MIESLRNQPECPPTIAQLRDIDPTVAERINALIIGATPNGHSPNGLLSAAMDEDNDAAQASFVREYRWGLRLQGHTFRPLASPAKLDDVAESALFVAGAEYQPEQQPNFLTHLQGVLKKHLSTTFGEPSPGLTVPALDEFDSYVIAKLQEEEDSLPLATERTLAAFSVAQRVLFLYETNLISGNIKAIHASSNNWKFGPPAAPLTEEELDEHRRTIEQTQKQVNRLPTRKHRLIRDPQITRLALSGMPEFSHLVPATNPGFVSIRSSYEPGGMITDIDRNTLITIEEWRKINKDSAYREAWIANGSLESLKESKQLQAAIAKRRLAEAQWQPQLRTGSCIRPRPRFTNGQARKPATSW